MFLSDIFEGRDAPLYHTMDYDKAMDVFEYDIMPAKWEHKIPGGDILKGNSFTRNKNLRWAKNVFLVCNQRAIAHSNKIVPLDGEYVWANSLDRPLPYNRQDRLRHQSPWGDREIWNPATKQIEKQRDQPLSEEFVIGDINKVHRIIQKIYLLDSDGLWSTKANNLYEHVKIYSEKFNIEFEASQKFLRMVKDYQESLEYDDD